MTLTVAIPSYNKEKYIDRCIKSVLEQKSLANEILVIDNCSTDRTFEIAQKYEPDIRCVRNSSNLGMAQNWNRCIELCQSDLLLILHADDELLPGALQAYLDFYNQHPDLGFVYADFYFIQDGNLANKQLTVTRVLEIAKAGPEAMAMPKGYACSTVVIPKKVYDQVGNFIESMSSDWEMLERIASRYDVGQIHQATANIHINNDSTGRNSLTNRTAREIAADCDNLNNKIISYYPPELRQKKAKEFKKSTAGLLILVFGRNLKIGQYKKAWQALTLSIFKYGGLGALFKSVRVYFMVKLRAWWAKRHPAPN